MARQNKDVRSLHQSNISWLNDNESNRQYFIEKHKLLILKRNLEHNDFHTNITLKIKRREK